MPKITLVLNDDPHRITRRLAAMIVFANKNDLIADRNAMTLDFYSILQSRAKSPSKPRTKAKAKDTPAAPAQP